MKRLIWTGGMVVVAIGAWLGVPSPAVGANCSMTECTSTAIDCYPTCPPCTGDKIVPGYCKYDG